MLLLGSSILFVFATKENNEGWLYPRWYSKKNNSLLQFIPIMVEQMFSFTLRIYSYFRYYQDVPITFIDHVLILLRSMGKRNWEVHKYMKGIHLIEPLSFCQRSNKKKWRMFCKSVIWFELYEYLIKSK